MGDTQLDDPRIIQAMAQADLVAYREYLDERIRGDKATLEDFGRLSRVLREIARRQVTVASEAGI